MKYFSTFTSVLFFIAIPYASFANNCPTDQSIATLEKFTGYVKYLPKKRIKTISAKPGQLVHLCENDRVITLKNSKAKIISNNGDVYLLDEESVLILNHSNKVTTDEGVAYFMIKKRHKTNSFIVKAKFSTIGVKGTQFLVRKSEKVDQVALTKGAVDVAPIEGDFELFFKNEMAAFNRFKHQQESDFDVMKTQMFSEFEAFQLSGQNYMSKGRVSNVPLKVGETVTISGERAILDKKQNQSILKKIQELKAFGR